MGRPEMRGLAVATDASPKPGVCGAPLRGTASLDDRGRDGGAGHRASGGVEPSGDFYSTGNAAQELGASQDTGSYGLLRPLLDYRLYSLVTIERQELQLA